jgi:hypothetical protein
VGALVAVGGIVAGHELVQVGALGEKLVDYLASALLGCRHREAPGGYCGVGTGEGKPEATQGGVYPLVLANIVRRVSRAAPSAQADGWPQALRREFYSPATWQVFVLYAKRPRFRTARHPAGPPGHPLETHPSEPPVGNATGRQYNRQILPCLEPLQHHRPGSRPGRGIRTVAHCIKH